MCLEKLICDDSVMLRFRTHRHRIWMILCLDGADGARDRPEIFRGITVLMPGVNHFCSNRCLGPCGNDSDAPGGDQPCLNIIQSRHRVLEGPRVPSNLVCSSAPPPLTVFARYVLNGMSQRPSAPCLIVPLCHEKVGALKNNPDTDSPPDFVKLPDRTLTWAPYE